MKVGVEGLRAGSPDETAVGYSPTVHLQQLPLIVCYYAVSTGGTINQQDRTTIQI